MPKIRGYGKGQPKRIGQRGDVVTIQGRCACGVTVAKTLAQGQTIPTLHCSKCQELIDRGWKPPNSRVARPSKGVP